MKNLILALALTLMGCMTPPTPPMDSGTEDACSPPVASQVVFPPAQEGILEVTQSEDGVGQPFQEGTLYVATEQYIINTDNPGDNRHRLVMYLNGERQTTTVWNARAMGIWHTFQVPSVDVVQPFCPNTMSFWRLDLGFGTYGEDHSDPGFSVVGHQLVEGQEVDVRFDVCSVDSCETGVTTRVRVHIR